MPEYKEPWSWETDLLMNEANTETWISADDGGGRNALIICTIDVDTPRFSREDFARRICSCVNAMRDIEDPITFINVAIGLREKLETMTTDEYSHGADRLARSNFDAAAGKRLFQVE